MGLFTGFFRGIFCPSLWLAGVSQDPLYDALNLSVSCIDTSSSGLSPVSPSPSAVTRQLQERWRNLRGLRAGSPVASGKRILSSLLFEVTDASVVQDGSSKYVVS